MNLKDLSKITLDSLQQCIENDIRPEDIEIYMCYDSVAVRPNSAQLRFSDVLEKHGILMLDNVE